MTTVETTQATSLPKNDWQPYAIAVGAVALAALAKSYILLPLVQQESPFLLFFTAVMFAAWFGGRVPGFFATALAAMTVASLYLAPVGSLRVADPGQVIRLMVFAGEGVLISMLCGSLHAARQQARNDQEQTALLVQGVKDYAIFMLDPEGRVVSWNAGAERIKGYRADEIMGRSFERFYPEAERAAGKPAEALAAAVRRGTFEEEGLRVRKDGSTFWASALIAALRDSEGRLRGFAKVTRDVTESHQAREALARTAEELERLVAERTRKLEEANEALTSFARTVAHDLRAPLRGMQGFAQALLEDYGDRLDALGRDYAGRIVTAAAHLDALIRELLSYSRLSRAELPLGPVGLDSVVDEALGRIETEMAQARRLVTVRSPLGLVLGHRSTLALVVQNLLTNALKFVAPGAEAEVRVWAEAQPGGRRRLWVEDHGIGIAPEHQGRIFQVFERLHSDDEYPGTGVGLATVAKAAERLGGAVGVESLLGKGSRFWIELPTPPEER